ncbi:12 kDa heat shock protein [[Candida] railenensis]|uniref:12 kDa heat shock protein n=1 Tax=[Candida] railenensis TaxID=45579 RepID=A0A9P0VYB7_9ASCO|nr:12 kDa heat shock protein [[Candida] railenensis]
MSDLGRKNVSDKVAEKITPDSEKTTFEKASEAATGAADKVASSITPDNQKSFTQSVSDNIQSGHDDAKTAVNKDQQTLAETASEYLETAKEEVTKAANYVSGVVTGATEGAKTASEDAKK